MRSCQWLQNKNKNKGKVKPEGEGEKNSEASRHFLCHVWQVYLAARSCGWNCDYWVLLLQYMMTPQRRILLLGPTTAKTMLV